jgi:antitoxin VapB
MALNIKDPDTERLAAEVAAMTGESKTRAVKVALEERRERLATLRGVRRDRTEEFKRFLEEEIWPLVPKHLLGKRLSKKDRERILGYGPQGV